ncbi:hypothetical protein ADUPG1_000930 [Aduncisulcus paluster]|uniref:Uncharacterized protein n=1 Tax=Aduncisulcus paluster TaxID=2918883 RepID=A0ABQ5K8L9_9EUKA|nr:hypothetical protein ADUPG1_000930 [Aduncisulcus paluster]
MEQQVTFTAPLLRFVGEKHFTRFKNEFATYRAAGGRASLYSLIRRRREGILGTPKQPLWQQDYTRHIYSLDTIKLREVSEDKVAAYVTKYKATLRRLAEDETLGDKALTEQFLKGIKHPRFRLRMKAALEGGYKDMHWTL